MPASAGMRRAPPPPPKNIAMGDSGAGADPPLVNFWISLPWASSNSRVTVSSGFSFK